MKVFWTIFFITAFLVSANAQSAKVILGKVTDTNIACLQQPITEEEQETEEDSKEAGSEKTLKNELPSLELINQIPAESLFYFHEFLSHFSAGNYSSEVFSPPEQIC